MAPGSTWTPKPCRSDVSAIARKLVGLANAVPPAHWVTYGDLAEAAGMGEAKNAARGAASALSFFPLGTPMAEWVLPWHRIRLENEHLKSRAWGALAPRRQRRRSVARDGVSARVQIAGSVLVRRCTRAVLLFALLRRPIRRSALPDLAGSSRLLTIASVRHDVSCRSRT
jgi:alkylated DNA nucleotide flippase Atl1